jgi:hypothetical protein
MCSMGNPCTKHLTSAELSPVQNQDTIPRIHTYQRFLLLSDLFGVPIMNHRAREFRFLKHIRFAFSLTSAESEFCLEDKCPDFHSHQQIHLLPVMNH